MAKEKHLKTKLIKSPSFFFFWGYFSIYDPVPSNTSGIEWNEHMMPKRPYLSNGPQPYPPSQHPSIVGELSNGIPQNAQDPTVNHKLIRFYMRLISLIFISSELSPEKAMGNQQRVLIIRRLVLQKINGAMYK